MERLQQLLRATPVPPTADAQPEEVLRLAEQMMIDRRVALAQLAELSAEIAAAEDHGPEVRLMLETLHDRDARWMAALGRARHMMGEHLGNMNRRRHATAAAR